MNSKITHHQYISIVLNSFIGVGILSLSSDLCKKAYQDGWISCIIGAFYPLVILLSASYIDKKMNHGDFWDILNILYGKFISYILLIMFILSSLFSHTSVMSGYINVVKLSISVLIPSIIIILLLFSVSIYTTLKGPTILGRLSELSLYFTLPVLILPIFFFEKGSITNLQPFFSSAKNIFEAVPESIFAYEGSEISFFILAYITNRKNVRNSHIIITAIITFIYTFVVFSSIYYLGWKLNSQIEYPLLFVFQLIRPPIFSNFKALFIMIWGNTVFITLSIEQFFINYSISKIFNLDYRKSCFLSAPLILAFILISTFNRDFKLKVLDTLSPYFSAFIFLFAIITFILTFFKSRGVINEKSENI